MSAPETTVSALGRTGDGKSEFLNAYLQTPAFTVSDDPRSCTGMTTSSENLVSSHLRRGIDTQGIEDSEGVDAANVQQMVSFLKDWTNGVNAFALVINGQSPRFDQGIQKLVKILDSFFNNNLLESRLHRLHQVVSGDASEQEGNDADQISGRSTGACSPVARS
jgi:predicted GTPase